MDELEQFKTEINLTEFAASLGYQLDRRKSNPGQRIISCPAA